MSVEGSVRCALAAPMSTSGSSAASDSPESDAVSVLDFAGRYAIGRVHQCNFNSSSRSSTTKRKRRREVASHEDERQLKPPCPDQQALHTSKQTQCPAVAPSSIHGVPCCSTPAVTPSLTTYYMAIHNCLLQWCFRLKTLQPKCVITNDVLHRSFDLFHRYRLVVQTTDVPSGRRQGVTAVHLAACLWVASKNDGNRACVPSRTLLTRAIAVCPEELTQAELVVCCKLQWNLFNSEVASARQF